MTQFTVTCCDQACLSGSCLPLPWTGVRQTSGHTPAAPPHRDSEPRPLTTPGWAQGLLCLLCTEQEPGRRRGPVQRRRPEALGPGRSPQKGGLAPCTRNSSSLCFNLATVNVSCFMLLALNHTGRKKKNCASDLAVSFSLSLFFLNFCLSFFPPFFSLPPPSCLPSFLCSSLLSSLPSFH